VPRKTILNHVAKHQSFVDQEARWADATTHSEIASPLEPRAKGPALCSGGGRHAPGYDRLPARRFEFVPLWPIAVFFVSAMRRVDCPRCGVTGEPVPGCDGQHPWTTTDRWFWAGGAKRVRGKGVAEALGTTWQNVFRSVKHAVSWGLSPRNRDGVESLGVDEVPWHCGHQYLTLVYPIDTACRRLLWIGQDRTTKTFVRFFRMFGAERSRRWPFVCRDLGKPSRTVIAQKASAAIPVRDRFHLLQKLNTALDEVRAGEARQRKADGYEPLLKHSRWCWLKRPENLTETHTVKLSELLTDTLRSVRASLRKEDFQRFWTDTSPGWAAKFLDEWWTRTLKSRLEPLKNVARTLRRHRELILNWFRAKGTISAGTVEGLTLKVKLTLRKSFAFRTCEAIETALSHNLGDLPEPEFTHKFW